MTPESLSARWRAKSKDNPHGFWVSHADKEAALAIIDCSKKRAQLERHDIFGAEETTPAFWQANYDEDEALRAAGEIE